MNILIISNFKPYPIRDGASQRIWTLANLINKENKVNILFNGYNRNIKIKKNINKINLIQVPFLFKFMLKKRFLFQLNPFLFIEFLKLIGQIDIVQIEFPYLLPFALISKMLGKKIILDQHGVEIIYQKEIHPKINKYLLKIVKIIEKTAIQISDIVLVCSDYDKKKIKQIYHIRNNKIKIIPNLINFKDFKNINEKGRKNMVLFIGSKEHYPNKVAIKYIKKIKPLIKAEFVIIGDKLHDLKRKKILSLIKSATICIAPIFQGSGTRIKILEYMANNKAVISTSKGAEGLKICNGKNIIIEDNLNKFIEKIKLLLNNKKRRESIGKNGYILIKKEYNIENYRKKVNSIYHNL